MRVVDVRQDGGMSVYAVRYTYDSRSDLQGEVRPEHRAYLRGLADRGRCTARGRSPTASPARC